MRSYAAPAKMPTVSPCAVGIKAEVSWRSVPDGCSTSLLNAASAKRRGLDRLIQQTVRMFYNLKFTLESKIIF
jgi:hypothetical protein